MLVASGRACARRSFRFRSGSVPAAEARLGSLSLGCQPPPHLSRMRGGKMTAYPRKTPCHLLDVWRPPGLQLCPPRSTRGVIVRERTVPARLRCPLSSALTKTCPSLNCLSSTRRRTRHRPRRWWTRSRCMPLRHQALCLRRSWVGLRSRPLIPLCLQTRRRPRRSRVSFRPQSSTLAPLPPRCCHLHRENPPHHWVQGPVVVTWGIRERGCEPMPNFSL